MPLRICHVTPHLPPDQAANALLPAHLGRWAAARGDEVTYVAHPPRAGSAETQAGPVVWVQPNQAQGLMRRIGSIAAARRIRRDAGDVIQQRRCGARAQQRAAGRGERAARARVGQARRADALRHRNLALRARSPGRSICSRPRIARRRASRSTAAACTTRRSSWGSRARDCRSCIRRSSTRSRRRRKTSARRCGRGSG